MCLYVCTEYGSESLAKCLRLESQMFLRLKATCQYHTCNELGKSTFRSFSLLPVFSLGGFILARGITNYILL